MNKTKTVEKEKIVAEKLNGRIMKINSRKLQLTREKSYACYSYLQIAINYQ